MSSYADYDSQFKIGNGPRIAESKPWDRNNSDGSMNLGSYAFAASVGMVDAALELVALHLRVHTPRWPCPDGEAMDLTRRLARALLWAADGAQAAVREDGRVDRMDNSHSRARGAVHSSLTLLPVPWHAAPALRVGWAGELRDTAAGLMALAVDLDK